MTTALARSQFRSRALLAAGSIGLLAGAQVVTTPEPYFEPVNSFDLNTIGYAGAVGRVVHGDPKGDLTGAMFFLVDTEVLWSPMPYALTSVAPLSKSGPVRAHDLVVLRADAGDRDVLVFSDEQGLSSARYQVLANEYAVAALPETGAWALARDLERQTLGSAQVEALSGILADGRTVRVAVVGESSETPLYSLTLPVDVMDHDLIDYDGDGNEEIAVVTSLGLFVFTQSGALMRRSQVPTANGGVVAFRSQGVDRLAFWYQDTGPGKAHVRVVEGGTNEPDVTLSVVPPNGSSALDVLPAFAAAGDYDADGNQDLLLQIHHHFCVLLRNRAQAGSPPPASHFGVAPGDYESIPVSSDPASPSELGAGWAYFGNVDSDPGDDLIVPVDDLDRIEVHNRVGLAGSPASSGFVGFMSDDIVAPESTYWWDPNGPVARLNLALIVPDEYLPGGADAYEYLQVASWFQDGATSELALLAEQNSLHALTTDERQWIGVEPKQTVSGSQQLLLGDHWPVNHNIWVVFRFVDVDENQNPIQVERASRFAVGAFTLRQTANGQSIPSYLSSLPGASPELSLYSGQFPDPSGGPSAPVGSAPGGKLAQLASETALSGASVRAGNGYVGAYVSQTSSVLFPPGDAPHFPNAVVGGAMAHY